MGKKATENYLRAVWKALKNDSGVSNNFGVYDNEPALFTGGKAPEGPPTPYGFVEAPRRNRHDNRYANKKSNPDEPRGNIRIYAERTLSSLPVTQAADAVKDALHDKPTVLNPYLDNRTCKALKCDGPSIGPTESEDLEGRVVEVRANFSDPDA